MSVFIGGPYGRLASMLNTLSSLNIEIIIIIINILRYCCVPGFTARDTALMILANKTVSGYPVIVLSAKYDALECLGLVKWRS